MNVLFVLFISWEQLLKLCILLHIETYFKNLYTKLKKKLKN